VKKAKVIAIFEIKLNSKTPETPVFSVWDYDEGVFARDFTTHSFSQLSMSWLTQNGQTGVTLTVLNGKKFVGLDDQKLGRAGEGRSHEDGGKIQGQG
jgi:hypothetical protein